MVTDMLAYVLDAYVALTVVVMVRTLVVHVTNTRLSMRVDTCEKQVMIGYVLSTI